MFRKLSVRLTLLYTILFSSLSLVVFSMVYHSLSKDLMLRIDTELLGDAQELARIYQEEGLAVLFTEAQKEAAEEGNDKTFFRIYSPEHEKIMSSDTPEWNVPAQSVLLNVSQESRYETIRVSIHGHRARSIFHDLGRGYIVQIGTSLTQDDRLLKNFVETFLFAFALLLLSGCSIGFAMARHALTGIEKVRLSANRISAGDLSQQIPTNGGSMEINNLISSFNRMQVRIQVLLRELQDVTNNVAHDLRSPVTRIRGLAETTLTGPQTLEEYQELASAVIEESDRLVGIINTMLEIAETDAGIRPISGETVDLNKIVLDVSDLFASLADDKDIIFTTEIPTQALIVVGDRSRLQRAFANLLDNAIKFTPKGGRVSMTLLKSDDQALLIFDDSGPGIPVEHLPRIYDRFFRGERSRTTTGNGLGLSLVKSIINIHGGQICVASAIDQGTRFTINLPLQRNLLS